MINTAYSLLCCAYGATARPSGEHDPVHLLAQGIEESGGSSSSLMPFLFVALGILLSVCAFAAWRLIFSEDKKQKDFRSEYDKSQTQTDAKKIGDDSVTKQVAKSKASADTVVSDDDGGRRASEIPAKLDSGKTVSAGDTVKDSDPLPDYEQPAKELTPREQEGDLASRKTVDSMGDQSVFMDDSDDDLDV